MQNMPDLPGMPKALKVNITYDHNLQKITGKDGEESIISKGMTFMQFLFFLFSSYPEIKDIYPPGKLGFLVNGEPPRMNDVLHEGDGLFFAGTGEDGITRTPWGFKATNR